MAAKDLNALCLEYQTTDRKHRPNHGNPDGFEPCPFCGACPHIRVEDDEGNCHDYDPDYEKNPWSGLWYVIEHTRDYDPARGNALKNTGDIPYNRRCLIATEGFQRWGFGSVPHIGGDKAVFKTRKAAVKWWNRMVAKVRPAEKRELPPKRCDE